MDIESIQEIAEQAMYEPRVHQFPEMVEGRTLHADADVLSYKACDLEYDFASNVTVLKDLIDVWRKLAGAEFIYLHLTLGTKGGREEIAKVKKYQGNRTTTSDEKRQRVGDLRAFMAEYSTYNVCAVPNYTQEADDSMTQAMYVAQERGYDSVLFTIDKDLWMVPGKHLNTNTLEIEEYPNGYGNCHLTVNSAGKKKLVGKGKSWFFHQLLMGDAADNIPGLPMMPVDLWTKYAPTKQLADVLRKLSSGRMPSGKLLTADQKRTAQRQYNTLCAKLQPKKVGQVLAHKYLETCVSEKMAYERVRDAYRVYYGPIHNFYSHTNTLMECSWEEMLLEQARLLWMKRKPEEDVKEYLESLL